MARGSLRLLYGRSQSSRPQLAVKATAPVDEHQGPDLLVGQADGIAPLFLPVPAALDFPHIDMGKGLVDTDAAGIGQQRLGVGRHLGGRHAADGDVGRQAI